jgi:hypothetical protein
LGSKPRRCRKHPEQDFQASLVQLLEVILTRETYFFAVPNGGFRTRTEAAILIGQGVKPGVPDLIFISRGKPFGLELKAAKGVVSDNQVTAHDSLRGAGMKIGIARTIDEAIASLKANDIPLRIAASGGIYG